METHPLKRWFTLACALVLPCALQAAEGPAPIHAAQVYNPALTLALGDIKKPLLAERAALSFEGGGSARNCAEYRDLLSRSAPTESTGNALARSEYLVCDAILLIAGRPFIAERAAVPRGLGKSLLEGLDLRSFPSSLRNRADARRHSLKHLLPGDWAWRDNALELETSDRFFRLEVVAAVNHTAGPGRGWLVWITDELKDGTYRSYRSAVVRKAPAAPGYAAALLP